MDMYETRQNMEKVSRRIETGGGGTRQRVQNNDSQAIQFYGEHQDANIHTMWNQRLALNIGNNTLPNNVAWCGGACARSGINGHSELKAMMTDFAMHHNRNINVHTERQPCQHCENDLRSIEKLMPGNIIVHYLVPYTGTIIDLTNLRALYHGLGYI